MKEEGWQKGGAQGWQWGVQCRFHGGADRGGAGRQVGRQAGRQSQGVCWHTGTCFGRRAVVLRPLLRPPANIQSRIHTCKHNEPVAHQPLPAPACLPDLQLGIPVRVTRKQKDKLSHLGSAFIFDGLVGALPCSFLPCPVWGVGVSDSLARGWLVHGVLKVMGCGCPALPCPACLPLIIAWWMPLSWPPLHCGEPTACFGPRPGVCSPLSCPA